MVHPFGNRVNVALVVEYVFEATFLPLDSETKQEDTESVASTVTSDISSKNQQSDSLQTKVKSKPIKTTASTSQSRLVYIRLRIECYTLSVTVQIKPVQQYFRMVLFVASAILTLESVDEILWCYHSNVIS